MKAITICQPWAWAIARGIKTVENRTWRTWYAGSLLIHAGKSRTWFTGEELNDGTPEPAPSSCVFGAIVAVCRIVGCVRLTDPRVVGNLFAEGPWCLMLDDVRTLRDPIPWQGAQGLWECPVIITPDMLVDLPDGRATI